MTLRRSPRIQFLLVLILASLASLGFYVYGAWRNHSLDYTFFPSNLVLAWLPLLFALRLSHVLGYKRWSSWEGIGWSVLWLLFLPNSFYMISDFVHLQEVPRLDVVYDIVMFSSFVYTAVALGFSSLYLVHAQLRRRLRSHEAAVWVAGTLLVCSLAIYIGRDLRWNSWDIITNPGGLLFDISDRLQNPAAYPQMLITTISFWILLGIMYAMLWSGIRVVRQPIHLRKPD
jgi:uncharacterized membrane protein